MEPAATPATHRPLASDAEPDRVLRLDGVRKAFGDVQAVDAVHLDVGREFFALLGPSGSGKTTLLRIIAGLEAPDSGRVLINGSDVTDLPPHRRQIGMVFQDFLLFPHRTVAENIVFPLRMQGMERERMQEQLAWVTDLVRLGGLHQRYPHQLSGGQKQRVALARGLVSRPSVLLLDEPLANLDRELRREMEIEVRRFQLELGIPFVYVTHNQEEALTMSDRMAVMRHGHLEQVGDKLELYHRPASGFIAAFLGSTNVLHATVASASPDRAIVSWQGRALAGVPGRQLEPGQPAAYYVKSEQLRIQHGPSSAGGDEVAVTGTVRDVIFRGASSDVLIAVGDTEVLATAAPSDPAQLQGAQVTVAWSPTAARIFAAEE